MSTARRENVDRIPGKIREVWIDHMNVQAEGCILIAGEEYAPIEGVRVTDSRVCFVKQSGHPADIIDERPSVRGRYREKLRSVFLRNAPQADIQADLEIDESMAHWYEAW